MSLFAYFGFWALIVLNVIIKWRRGMLLDALAKSRKKEARAAARAARKQVWGLQGFPDTLHAAGRAGHVQEEGSARGRAGRAKAGAGFARVF